MAAPRRVPLPFIGPSSKASSSAQQSGRTVNLYPEINDPDAKAVVALHACPGFFRWADEEDLDALDLPIRGFHTAGDRWFAVVGNKVVEVTRDISGTDFAAINTLSTLSTYEGRVGMSDNSGKLIVGDGSGFWIIDLDTLVKVPLLNDGEERIRGWISRYIDGTTLYFLRDSSTYYYSEINDPATVRGLNFFSAEGSPDFTVNAHILGQQIVILGQRSVEWHYDSGDADNPFQRIQGGYQEHGSIGRWASCRFDNSIVMVGRNQEGQGKVLRLGGAGTAPQVISSPAVEQALAKVGFAYADVTERVTMWAYEDAGHAFFLTNLPMVPGTVNNPAQPSQTWSHDAASGLWHERAYMNPETGLFERIRSDFHALWKGRHYTGDYALANIYEMSLDYYRENTLPLIKLRESAGPLSVQGKRFTVHKLRIEMETGVGRDGGVQGSDPKLIMQYSWDGGRNWSDEVWRDIGAMGQTKTTVEFGPCGSGHDFNIRVIVAEPIRVTMTGAWADVTVGR